MSAPTNRWKLGAFVVAATVLGLLGAAALAARTMQVVTVSYTSYFDEAVTGLEVGSPISFRGVRIGNVTAISVAPDRRHVEIVYSLGVTELNRLGIASAPNGKEITLAVPAGLRIQIASTGLTGARYLQLDFFDTDGAPPPELPFPVAANYIPAMPSTMKNLEDAVVRAVDQIPGLALELGGAAARLNLILDDVHRRGLPARTAASLERADRLMGSLQVKLDELPVAQLSRQASATLLRLDGVLARLDGDDGLLASAQRASDGVADLTGPRLGADLLETSRDLREGAVAVRQLVEALQRDPDMLLKGRAKVTP